MVQTEVEQALIEQQLEELERSAAPRTPVWAWVLIGLGVVLILGLSVHAYGAYLAIDRLNQPARIDTDGPVSLFQKLATTGPQVSAAIDSSSRATYARSLDQYIFDGTGICLGIALVVAGLFIRWNR
jgi:hypothetical protein